MDYYFELYQKLSKVDISDKQAEMIENETEEGYEILMNQSTKEFIDWCVNEQQLDRDWIEKAIKACDYECSLSSKEMVEMIMLSCYLDKIESFDINVEWNKSGLLLTTIYENQYYKKLYNDYEVEEAKYLFRSYVISENKKIIRSE